MRVYTASEILDRQVDVGNWLETTLGRDYITYFTEDLIAKTGNPAYATMITHGLGLTIWYGESYYLNGDVMEVVKLAADKLPEESLMSDVVPPSPNGFIQLQEPLELIDVHNKRFEIWALGWAMAEFVEGTWSDEAGKGFIFSAWTQPYPDTNKTPLDLFWMGPWYSNMTISAEQMRTQYPDEPIENLEKAFAQTVGLVKTFMAFFGFVQQRLPMLTVTPTKTSRATRRRAERFEISIPSEVKIVELRRRDQATHYGTGEKKIEWTHRWITDGHWKRQWYPSEKTHHLIWIDAYIKGPPDAPLVLRDKLFHVRR